MLTDLDDNWPAVVDNLRKAQKRWEHISWILERKGSDPWNSCNFYKAVVQSTILFVEESWVISTRIGRTLGGFHHRVDHWLSKMQPKRDVMGRWISLPLDAAMKAVGLEEVET